MEESFEREFRPSFMTFTTGRSAQPLPFLYTDHDLRHLKTAGGRIMRICGAKREMKMLNMFPYAPHLAFWQAHYAGTEFGVFMVGSGGGKVAGTEGNLRIMQKLAPEVLIGMPTFIYHVLQAAVEPQPALPAAFEAHPRRRKSAGGHAPQTQGPRRATRARARSTC